MSARTPRGIVSRQRLVEQPKRGHGCGLSCFRPHPAIRRVLALAALNGNTTASLSGSLRGLLLDFLPDPLFEDRSHWGTQKPVNEIRWRGKGPMPKEERAKLRTMVALRMDP